MQKLAQAAIQIAPQGGFTGFGTLGNPGGSGITIFTNVISASIGLLTAVSFIWFIYIFITGAIGVMMAEGDSKKLETARQRITHGLIGMIIVVMAVSIISLIGFLFNVPFLNLPYLFQQITSTATGGNTTVGPGTR